MFNMKLPTVILLLVVSTLALPDRSGRIWNGEEAVPHEAPFMIGMLWLDFDDTDQPINFCGGALINQYWIVTAAHCIENNLTSRRRVEIIAGQHDVRVTQRTGREQIRVISAEFLHPQFAGGVSSFDIALIRVMEPFEFNEFVQPITLPSNGHIHSGDVQFYGWGSIAPQPPHVLPDRLQTVRLPIIPHALCREVLDTIWPQAPFDSTDMCTGPLDGSRHVCNADSGGPSVQQNSQGQIELVGLLAWGVGNCNSANAPSVSCRVSGQIEWIEQIMANNPPPA